ncbi:conserved protein of unknown function [Limnospira indica PCC 8005]|uniref:Uncharacterized protein n=1 Tax=Limnospira indica PCC 8005 TaxID=376219 RepID=A0A9P1KG93_9CYAN|nr:conserved protein of unknown function [Limnospira indica PCC 8005]
MSHTFLDNLDSEAMPILTRCPHLVAQQEGSPIITHYVACDCIYRIKGLGGAILASP